jgi:PHD/YefM family antitoxin component YafN of YafNO toxin-antitoxin module/mRNA-degrading endonuclease RelE of RelBE toxin-antitoxin system
VKTIDVFDLPDGARELVGECEITGRQTLFQRHGRSVAILISHDEYVALRETIEIAADPKLREKLTVAETEVAKGEIDEPASRVPNDRLRIPDSAAADIAAIDAEVIRKAFERIDEDPIIGAPLFDPYRGWWSYRTEQLRVIYRIVAEARFVVILSVQKVGG